MLKSPGVYRGFSYGIYFLPSGWDAVLLYLTLFFCGITFAGKGFLQSLFNIIDLHEGGAVIVHIILGKMYAGFGVV